MKELLDLVSLRAAPRRAPASSPMATSAGSSSSARSRRGRGCSCSTSRPPGWTRARPGASCKLIEQIRDRYGLAVIVVEHDMDLIMNLCERIQVLAHGERIFEGTPAEVQASPRVREVYLGHA